MWLWPTFARFPFSGKVLGCALQAASCTHCVIRFSCKFAADRTKQNKTMSEQAVHELARLQWHTGSPAQFQKRWQLHTDRFRQLPTDEHSPCIIPWKRRIRKMSTASAETSRVVSSGLQNNCKQASGFCVHQTLNLSKCAKGLFSHSSFLLFL